MVGKTLELIESALNQGTALIGQSISIPSDLIERQSMQVL